eukprot:TRINITY_DN17681_c0_g1_i1.p1 TRINITY_DN17681_c0_g1~~TRINITY_DN17681_c0_g1_i1.p1  ORF type:complete len:502 (-),score=104.05 TRINITY_DN17681_c0_g1_i1:116-1621(-)
MSISTHSCGNITRVSLIIGTDEQIKPSCSPYAPATIEDVEIEPKESYERDLGRVLARVLSPGIKEEHTTTPQTIPSITTTTTTTTPSITTMSTTMSTTSPMVPISCPLALHNGNTHQTTQHHNTRKKSSKEKRRISVFRNGHADGGLVIPFPSSWDSLLRHSSESLNLKATRIFLSDGGEIKDLEFLHENDKVYCSQGEPFRLPTKISSEDDHDWVTLNVGGKVIATSLKTLTKTKGSMLEKMFSDEWESTRDINGNILIDRNPDYFAPLLNYLRCGELIIDEGVNPVGVFQEAKFFGIPDLQEKLQARIDEIVDTDIDRRSFVTMVLSTSSSSSLRCQGLNLKGINLSKLDLSNINFKMALFRGADLSYCNFDDCSLQGTDFRGANLSYSSFRGANLCGANLSGANLKGANFEDRGGKHANLEGANLNNAILEDANFCGADLRAAFMKSANMVNCNFIRVNFAGADLEGSDMRGANLHKAILSCNLKNAEFDVRTVNSRK